MQLHQRRRSTACGQADSTTTRCCCSAHSRQSQSHRVVELGGLGANKGLTISLHKHGANAVSRQTGTAVPLCRGRRRSRDVHEPGGARHTSAAPSCSATAIQIRYYRISRKGKVKQLGLRSLRDLIAALLVGSVTQSTNDPNAEENEWAGVLANACRTRWLRRCVRPGPVDLECLGYNL
jgi:hypothetical protein